MNEQATPAAPHARLDRCSEAPHQGDVGVTFRETMTGFLALGERDPSLGERVARARGTMLRLHARLEIPDLETFVRDPQHSGRLTGAVEIPGIGVVEARHGVFRLFAPPPFGYAPDQRMMIYELSVRIEGRPCLLVAERALSGGPAWRMWPEASTLHTRLHDGPSRRGEVMAAGVLRLGFGRLLGLLLTLRGTGGESVAARMAAVLRFGGFCAEQLRLQRPAMVQETVQREA